MFTREISVKFYLNRDNIIIINNLIEVNDCFDHEDVCRRKRTFFQKYHLVLGAQTLQTKIVCSKY